jgi:hypothetical protein
VTTDASGDAQSPAPASGVDPEGSGTPQGDTALRELNVYEANRELFEELDRETRAASRAMDCGDMDAWATHAARGSELYREIAERLGWETSAPRYDDEPIAAEPVTEAGISLASAATGKAGAIEVTVDLEEGTDD